MPKVKNKDDSEPSKKARRRPLLEGGPSGSKKERPGLRYPKIKLFQAKKKKKKGPAAQQGCQGVVVGKGKQGPWKAGDVLTAESQLSSRREDYKSIKDSSIKGAIRRIRTVSNLCLKLKKGRNFRAPVGSPKTKQAPWENRSGRNLFAKTTRLGREKVKNGSGPLSAICGLTPGSGAGSRKVEKQVTGTSRIGLSEGGRKSRPAQTICP